MPRVVGAHVELPNEFDFLNCAHPDDELRLVVHDGEALIAKEFHHRDSVCSVGICYHGSSLLLLLKLLLLQFRRSSSNFSELRCCWRCINSRWLQDLRQLVRKDVVPDITSVNENDAARASEADDASTRVADDVRENSAAVRKGGRETEEALLVRVPLKIRSESVNRHTEVPIED